jgi:hypothetical protein
MARPPLFRRKRSADIRRVLTAHRTEGLMRAMAQIRAKGGSYLENDPDDYDAWWSAVTADPRSARSWELSLAADHPEAWMRLDRLVKRAQLITFQCWDCRQRGTFTIADVIRERGGDTNANAVGEGLLDCPDPYARRNGRFCRFRFELGGFTSNVRPARKA